MTEPHADRPHVPGYGIPESVDGILPWSWARERLEAAIVYWLATTGADGAPHLIPIWGAWVGDRWYVEGGPTRWQRNLRENPKLAIHIEIGDEVVIDCEAAADKWQAGGLWELRPVKAFAWSVFPTDMTRFRFGTT